jgi:hypothetical protein
VLVGQFEFVEWTPDKHLRHSRFVGIEGGEETRVGPGIALTRQTFARARQGHVPNIARIEKLMTARCGFLGRRMPRPCQQAFLAARFLRTTPASAQTRTPTKPTVVGSGTCDKLNWPELSVYKLSASMKVMVGSTSEKEGKPSAESVVKGSVRLKGGLPLPNPSAASAGKIWTVLSQKSPLGVHQNSRYRWFLRRCPRK